MLKIIFAATPQLACPSLEVLLELAQQGQIHISALLTQPDKPSGRKRILQPSKVKARALELGIKNILTPEKLNTAVHQQIAELQPNLLVVFGYGKIFRQKFLNLFPLGGINLHPSALPQWRGPSPIEAQLLAGAEQLAISVQRISLEMDAGDILRQEFYSLPATADYSAAARIAAQKGAAMLRRCCEQIVAQGQNYLETAKPQAHEQASYCHIIHKENGRLDWTTSALQLSRQCRAYAVWPKIYTFLPWAEEACSLHINIFDAKIWQVSQSEHNILKELIGGNHTQPGSLLALHPHDGLLVRTGDGILAIQKLQRQNKNVCSTKEFANQLQNGKKQQYQLPKWGQLPILPGTKLYQFEI